MNEGNSAMSRGAMSNGAVIDARCITGVPGLAVRIGRALEAWGREVSRPVDRETLRREYERQRDHEARMLASERFALQRW